MLILTYLFRRKPGLTREEFLHAYAQHRNVMLGYARGLIAYTQSVTTAPISIGGIESNTGASSYDAVSTYIYQSAEDADFTSNLPAVAEDSQRFIDFESMLTLTVDAVKVR